MKNGAVMTVNGGTNASQAVEISGKVQKQLERALKGLMKGNDEGVVTVAQLKKAAGESEEVVLEFMGQFRGKKDIDMIEGRRLMPTRIVFGEALEKWRHSEVVRAEWRKRNNKTPTGADKGGRGRGRPRGSASTAIAVRPQASLEVPKRRGRPPGSVNVSRLPIRPARTVRAQIVDGEKLANLNLRITVGENSTVLPLQVDLVPAA